MKTNCLYIKRNWERKNGGLKSGNKLKIFREIVKKVRSPRAMVSRSASMVHFFKIPSFGCAFKAKIFFEVNVLNIRWMGVCDHQDLLAINNRISEFSVLPADNKNSESTARANGFPGPA